MSTVRRSAEEQFTLILECRNSGLSVHQWCLEHDIKPGTFYNWVKRLKKIKPYCIPEFKSSNTREQPKQDIVPIKIIDDNPLEPACFGKTPYVQSTGVGESTGYTMEITAKSGTMIKVNNNISLELFHLLLDALEGQAC